MYITSFAAEASGRVGHHSPQSRGGPSENVVSSLHSSLQSSVLVRLKTSASSVRVRRRVERESERPRAGPVVVTVVVAGTAVTGAGVPSAAPRASDALESVRPWESPKRGVALLGGETDAGERYEGVCLRLICSCRLRRRCFWGHS